MTVSKAERSRLMHHRPAVLWFTGLPGAGKSTIANLVEADAARARRSYRDARRRQCAARLEPGPRLYRGRPGREHPPHRRGGQADDRRRADRALLVHLAVPRRAPHGAGTARRQANSSRSSSTRRSRNASRAIPRASIGARWPARSRISPASISPTKCRKIPSCIFWPGARTPIGSRMKSSRRWCSGRFCSAYQGTLNGLATRVRGTSSFIG